VVGYGGLAKTINVKIGLSQALIFYNLFLQETIYITTGGTKD